LGDERRSTTLLSYPFPLFGLVTVVAMLTTIAVPLFAFVWLVVFWSGLSLSS
jgi:hypothetical protein